MTDGVDHMFPPLHPALSLEEQIEKAQWEVLAAKAHLSKLYEFRDEVKLLRTLEDQASGFIPFVDNTPDFGPDLDAYSDKHGI